MLRDPQQRGPHQHRQMPPREYQAPPRQERNYHDDEGGGLTGGLIFLLIFGVGNWILYKTTGWLIIPIPRR